VCGDTLKTKRCKVDTITGCGGHRRTVLLAKLISKHAHQNSSQKLFGKPSATRGSWVEARTGVTCIYWRWERAMCVCLCGDCVKQLSQWGHLQTRLRRD